MHWVAYHTATVAMQLFDSVAGMKERQAACGVRLFGSEVQMKNSRTPSEGCNYTEVVFCPPIMFLPK